MSQTQSAVADRIASRHDGWTYVALDTVGPLAERVRAMVETGRPMTLIKRWLTEENTALEVYPGLAVAAPAEGAREHVCTWTREDQRSAGFYVDCEGGIMRSWGFRAYGDREATEAQVAARWNEKDSCDARRDVTRVRVTGWPSSTDACVTIEHHNDVGLGEQTVIAFAMLPDDQEVADSQIEVLDALAQAQPTWNTEELGALAEKVRWNHRTVAEALTTHLAEVASRG